MRIAVQCVEYDADAGLYELVITETTVLGQVSSNLLTRADSAVDRV